jgi:hypothetical protein
MIEVFKTNVTNELIARIAIDNLKHSFPALHVNFDLADCDKVLRIASQAEDPIDVEGVKELLSIFKITIEVLPDAIPDR